MTAFIPFSFASASRKREKTNVVNLSATVLPEMHSSLVMAEAQTLPSGATFEPILPDMSMLVGFSSLVVLLVVTGWVWANQVVPVSRTKLATSKNNGEVRDYLDELRAGQKVSGGAINTIEGASDDEIITATSTTDGRDFERWLFTDWLQKPVSKGGRQKEPALPILKDAKWNSGDNPVVVAAALMIFGVIFTACTERIASFL